MLNVMKSEFYKVIHRKCMYVFFIVFGLGGFSFNLVLKALEAEQKSQFPGNSILDGWANLVVSIGWFIVYMIAQTVHSNESKTLVLKNSISYGTSRTKIYLGRLLAELVALIVAVAVVSLLVLAGVGLFFSGLTFAGIKEYYIDMGMMFVMWAAAVAMAHALAMVLNSNTLATVIYILYFSLALDILRLVKMALPKNDIVSFLCKYEIRSISMSSYIENGFESDWWRCFIVAAVYFAVFFVVGLVLFRRKEVK